MNLLILIENRMFRVLNVILRYKRKESGQKTKMATELSRL